MTKVFTNSFYVQKKSKKLTNHDNKVDLVVEPQFPSPLLWYFRKYCVTPPNHSDIITTYRWWRKVVIQHSPEWHRGIWEDGTAVWEGRLDPPPLNMFINHSSSILSSLTRLVSGDTSTPHDPSVAKGAHHVWTVRRHIESCIFDLWVLYQNRVLAKLQAE